MDDTDRVLIFLKAPRPGTVKTRLAADLGPQAACAVYRRLAERQIAALESETGPVGTIEVHYAPAGAATESEMCAWLGVHYRYLPQCDGDLGARLAHATANAFATGARRVALIGADCPALDAARVRSAFAALVAADNPAGADAVFGPALDGGYYLLALAAPRPAVFDRIPWSTTDTLRASLDRAAAAGLRVSLLPEEDDIDDIASLRRAEAAGKLRDA